MGSEKNFVFPEAPGEWKRGGNLFPERHLSFGKINRDYFAKKSNPGTFYPKVIPQISSKIFWFPPGTLKKFLRISGYSRIRSQ